MPSRQRGGAGGGGNAPTGPEGARAGSQSHGGKDALWHSKRTLMGIS